MYDSRTYKERFISMRLIYFFQIIILFCLLFIACTPSRESLTLPGTGVPLNLAEYRQRVLSNLQYGFDFDIPQSKSGPITVNETITFDYSLSKYPLFVDYKCNIENIEGVEVNGTPVRMNYQNEHVKLERKWLKNGANRVLIRLKAGEKPLNRSDDYLYTLLVPDKMRYMVPCFDQPSLKARFKLRLTIPAEWNALSNAEIADSVIKGGRKTFIFHPSDLISNYLFSFVAGRFRQAEGMTGNMKASFLFRETEPTRVQSNLPVVFRAHTDALSFLENWTGIRYPFSKFGFAAIPDFQFGGMEHVGAIQYKASALFLDEGATRDQLIARSNLISHETSHMWFGDLVTMKWFNDVWMKEVFANFMADKVTESLMGKDAFELKFLTDHYPAAYSVDRSRGTHPVRQELDNLQDAGSLYGNIIYHKAPIVMRQLERLMGKEAFQSGVREYLQSFSYGNASWTDLITILKKHSNEDIEKWNRVWIDGSGRPVLDYKIEMDKGRVVKFLVGQHSEYGGRQLYPQKLQMTFFYPDSLRKVLIDLNSRWQEVKETEGWKKPSFIIFNSDGQGYGLMPMDRNSLGHVPELKDPVMRAATYISLYENMICGRYVSPDSLIHLFADFLLQEKEELNIKILSGYLTTAFWAFCTPGSRNVLSMELEDRIWMSMEKQGAPGSRKLLLKLYQDVFLSDKAYTRLYNVWSRQQPPVDIKLSTDDYSSLSQALALRKNVNGILNQQLSRITDPDRRARFSYIMPALSTDERTRDSVFKSFRLPQNRTKEVWVLSSLSYLHHPLRQSEPEKHLTECLEMLEEIKNTGDIFFPQSWLQSTLSYYQTPEAFRVVSRFIKSHPGYDPALKSKILQAADNLWRSQLVRNDERGNRSTHRELYRY